MTAQVSNDILKLPNGQLELEKPFKLFDMKKFQQNVNRELKRQYPERHKLETQVGGNVVEQINSNHVDTYGIEGHKRDVRVHH
jgi:hypothetical protein